MESWARPGRTSPWANERVAPLQAAGAFIPVVEESGGFKLGHQLHGTVFFVSDWGLFLTAAHVVQGIERAGVAILAGAGLLFMRVEEVCIHPDVDLAFGRVIIDPHHPTKICPLAISATKFIPGEEAAILGYPHTVIGDERSGQTLGFTPDYFQGDVLDHQSQGVGLARGSVYVTDITIPTGSGIKSLSGASGGPLVTTGAVAVRGALCSASEGYSICTDIEHALAWSDFRTVAGSSLSIVDA